MGMSVMMGVTAAAEMAGAAGVLYETSFADGAKDWTPIHNATVSDVARRPGGKSLVIRQAADEEADSAWLSPVLKNPGAPVTVSVWAADNYDSQKDASYAAAFELVACDTNGAVAAGETWDFTVVPWEDKRQIPQFRHTQTREGLQWKYYESTRKAPGDVFRVRLRWPKKLMRGECYFTDVSVRTATSATPAPAAAGPAASRYALDISSGANGNLFFADDPLRFDLLLFATDGQPVGDLSKPSLRYAVTDYEGFQVAAGTLPFENAAPVTDRHLAPTSKNDPKRDRSRNLRVSILLPDASAREVGRELFLNVQVLDGDTVLAGDTVTYAVVNPRPIAPGDIAKRRFVQFAEGGGLLNPESRREGQALLDKMGTALIHNWDYNGWIKAQPTLKDPIKPPKLKPFPKMVFCPNIEQWRGNKDRIEKLIPDGAKVDDPRTPGCPTFDIDAYVAYMVEFVRVNRETVVQVVPSGLERFIDARTLELQRKAYAALKKEFPDLPVGMMCWGVNASEEAVNQILREKLYEVADFFDTHVYLSTVDWTASERLRRELKKLGLERPLISTEFARVGGCDQLQGSRDLIAAMLDAHAHGMYRVTYFLMYVNEVPGPPLRDPILRGEFPGDGFQWMQYVDRPRVSDAIKDPNWGRGLYGTDQRGASLMPMLKATAYYNFVQAVECADFKAVFQPTLRSIAYVYARDGKTICYLFLREPNAPTTLALTSDVPYVMQDLYGRTDRVTPAGGASLVVATLDPLLLTFDGEVPALHDAKTAPSVLKPAEGGLVLPAIARGTTGKAQLTLPPAFGKAFKARVVATVDGTWPKVKEEKVKVAAGKSSQVELPIAIAAGQAAGSYTFTTRLYDGDKLVSVLKQPLQVSEVLTAQMTGVPMTKAQDPAIAVSLRSLADKPMSGTVRITNRFFGTGFDPAVMEQAYTVGPQGTVEIRFPVPRNQANLASSYELRATITDKSGFTITSEDDVSFQACVKTKMPIKVDGDLSDWKLDELIPIPYEKWYRGPRDPKEFSGRFYSRWDDEKLYFAAEITDSVPVVNGTNQVFWNDDNIMFCLYPWGWHMGEPLNTGYYREHLGPIQGGKASFMRVGYVPSGPATSEGAEIAVTRTATGWVYEWAYPKASLYPLALGKGGAFRLSMSVWDQFKVEKKTQEDWGQFSWLTFAGFNSSVNAQPNLWRQFQMVE
jgi:hypothetical protein